MKAIVYWNSQGAIYIGYSLKGGQNGQKPILCRIIGSIAEKTAPFGKEKSDLAHTSVVATSRLIELGYEMLPHQPYSSDFNLCDFFCFQT